MAKTKGTGLLVLWADIDEAYEAEYNRWYEEEHLRRVARQHTRKPDGALSHRLARFTLIQDDRRLQATELVPVGRLRAGPQMAQRARQIRWLMLQPLRPQLFQLKRFQ